MESFQSQVLYLHQFYRLLGFSFWTVKASDSETCIKPTPQKNSSPQLTVSQLSATCRPTVGQQSADRLLTVGRLSCIICGSTVSRILYEIVVNTSLLITLNNCLKRTLLTLTLLILFQCIFATIHSQMLVVITASILQQHVYPCAMHYRVIQNVLFKSTHRCEIRRSFHANS